MKYSKIIPKVSQIKPKIALITGINGQDGYYLAEFLFEKGYIVHGIDKELLQHPTKIKRKTEIKKLDLTKPNLLNKLILKIKPDEIYHLAAYHFSSQQDGNNRMSFEPFNAINLLAANEILETIRGDLPKCKFFYASSSHVFGKVDHSPQNEETPYRPESLYAITKAAGNELCKFYRDYHNVYASVGILYNHESPLRSLSFITAQIAETAAKASLGLPARLTIKDLDGIVDWGAAQDYVNAMWLTLQQPKSDDYIIATGVQKKVCDFVQVAFDYVGLNANDFISQDPTICKIVKVPFIGNSTKIRKVCNWTPRISFNELVIEMVESHIKRLKEIHQTPLNQ